MNGIRLLERDGDGRDGGAALRELLRSAGLRGPGGGIRCPLCGWRPHRAARWQCHCGHVWNTFETRGVCPACDHRFGWTQCLRCHRRSDHEAWYVREGPCRS